MKILTIKKTAYLLITLIFCSINILGQSNNLTVTQDPKFEQILNEKRKVNSSITINDRYKIQIYSGDSETSKKTLTEFRRDYKNYDGTIVFSTPAYKVWVGNFKTRIDAEKNLTEFKGRYANAFLIKPNK